MLRSLLETGRQWIARRRLRRRRSRLVRATAKQQRILYDRPNGISPLWLANDELRARGVLDFAVKPGADPEDLSEGEINVVWHWPPDAPDVDDPVILGDGPIQKTLAPRVDDPDGMRCHNCKHKHTDWDNDGSYAVDDGHNAGIIERWECGICGAITEGGRR